MAFEAVHAVAFLEFLGFEIQSAGELVDGAGFRDVDQSVSAFDQLVTFGPVEFLRCPGHRVDVLGSDRIVIERISQLRGPERIRSASAQGFARTAPMRSTRSMTPTISMHPHHEEGVSQS